MTLKIIFLSILFTILTSLALAQPDPNCPPDNPNCPIDGGVVLLLAAGAGLAAKKALREKNIGSIN